MFCNNADKLWNRTFEGFFCIPIETTKWGRSRNIQILMLNKEKNLPIYTFQFICFWMCSWSVFHHENEFISIQFLCISF